MTNKWGDYMKYYDVELNKVLNENELRKGYEEYIKHDEVNINFGQYIGRFDF